MGRLIRKASWWVWLGPGIVLAAVLCVVLWPSIQAQEPQPIYQGIEVQFDSDNYTISEGATLTITVTLTQSSSQPVAVQWTASGTESDGTYYQETGTLEFEAGETAKSVAILLEQDSCCQGTRRLIATLSNPNGAVLGTPSTARVNVLDDDVCPE